MRRIVLVLVLVFSAMSWAAGGDMGGADPNGSAEHPYLIEDVNDFDVFAGDSAYWASGVYTTLMTDIDLSGRTYTAAVIAPDTDSTNDPWNFDGTPFTGIFDGNDHIIRNLTIDAGQAGYVGLFGRSEYGEIRNIGVVNVDVTGDTMVGGLVSDNIGTVTHCYSTGTVRGSDMFGGLVGRSNFGSITNSYSTCTVKGQDSFLLGGVGGLVGGSGGGNIENCYSNGIVTGSNYVGGLCGVTEGWGTTVEIRNCYSSGIVTGSNYVGGLCGGTLDTYDITTYIENSYSTCKVTGDSYVGGLIGFGWAWHCFWDVETSGIADPEEGVPDTDGMIGLSTALMQTQSSFTDWDFSTPVWRMLREHEDYPRLAWQETFAGDIAGLYGVDMVDFAELAWNWLNVGCPANCEDADIDESGDVGLEDLSSIAEDWLSK